MKSLLTLILCWTITARGFSQFDMIRPNILLTGTDFNSANKKDTSVRIYSISFNHTSSFIAAGCSDGSIHVRNAFTGDAAYHATKHTGKVNGVRYSHKGKYLASVGADGKLVIMDLELTTQWERPNAHKKEITYVDFSWDDKYVITSSADCTLKLWKIGESCELVHTFRDYGNWGIVKSVSFSKDNQWIFAVYHNHLLKWKREDSSAPRQVYRFSKKDTINALASSDRYLMYSRRGDLIMESVHDKREVDRVVRLHGALIHSIAVDSANRYVMTSSADRSIRVYNEQDNTSELLVRERFPMHTTVFSPNGKLCASAGHEGRIRIWRVLLPNKPAVDNQPTDYINSLVKIEAGIWKDTLGKKELMDKRYGHGFVIGRNNNKLYILTASHLIPNPLDPLPVGIRCSFKNYAFNEKDSISTLVFLDTEADFAVIEISQPNGYEFQRFAAYSTIDNNAIIHYIGKSSSWDIPPEAGQIVENDESTTVLTISIKNATYGASGGPIIGYCGIMGLIIKSDPTKEMKAIPLNEIKRRLGEKLNIFWDLRECTQN